jgi:hypothetical protein
MARKTLESGSNEIRIVYDVRTKRQCPGNPARHAGRPPAVYVPCISRGAFGNTPRWREQSSLVHEPFSTKQFPDHLGLNADGMKVQLEHPVQSLAFELVAAHSDLKC